MALTLCGCWYPVPAEYGGAEREYLPQVQLESHTKILSTTSTTTLKQVFVNLKKDKLDEVQYTFPLYDGVSIVAFNCTIGSKVLVGVVKEKQQARIDYQAAIDRGETAGLLEQIPEASDAFTTKVGNIPAGEKIHVEITYLGELKQDAETDGTRFTIPTNIAPRYGPISQESSQAVNTISANDSGGIKISVDVALGEGSIVRGLQSPSHPIAVTMGRTSSMEEDSFDNTYASATLSLGTTELDKDFIIVVQSKEQGTPRALLETHPVIPNQRVLMTTLVPKFEIPNIIPEIVFIVDRSGSMDGKIPTLVAALKIFLKSLPANGIKFNVCSFGSDFSFLFKRSRTYDQTSLKEALAHLDTFGADYGGTEMLKPVKATCKNRFTDMPLEVMVLTDGQIWNQEELFEFVNEQKNTRFFSLGIGSGASTALVEGIARAGGGFAQFVGEQEKMDKRVVRMLKGALTPHITDYRLEVKYRDEGDDDFEMIESSSDSLKTVAADFPAEKSLSKKVISLFDPSAKEEAPNPPSTDRFAGLPAVLAPKVLQAPHQIPSLYTFDRTTVYLLLRPGASQKTPVSVTLRGTSEHGSLELEIPIQDVGRGETLHKLAAKKAVHELEQGRGWVTDLKVDNKPLKTKYEGRWDLMVERECVQLGVEFQVAGKYCSFVAVQKKDEDGKDLDKDEERSEAVSHKPNVQVEGVVMHARRSPSSFRSLSQNLGFGTSSTSVRSRGGKGGPAVAMAAMAPPPPSFGAPAPVARARMSKPAPGAFSASSTFASQVAPAAALAPSPDLATYQSGLMVNHQQAAADRRFMIQDAAMLSSGGGGAAHTAKSELAKKSTAVRHQSSAFNYDKDDDMEMPMDLPLEEASAPETPKELSNDEKMHKIIEIQEFDGSWTLTETLLDLLSVAKDKIAVGVSDKDKNVRATAWAVAWLESVTKSEEDVWEMVVEKAKKWLKEAVGAVATEKAISEAKVVLRA